jgi:transcription-repair coupling factor (superfamily II helicase)
LEQTDNYTTAKNSKNYLLIIPYNNIKVNKEVDPILSALAQKFSSLEAYKSLISRSRKDKVYITGLTNLGKLFLLSRTLTDCPKKVIYIVKNESDQIAIERGLQQLTDRPVYGYPDLKSEQINRQQYIHNFQNRTLTAHALKNGEPGLFIFSVQALIEPLTNPAQILTLEINQNKNPEEILAALIAAGYDRQQKVFQAGEIAMRGGILDIYPVNFASPVRLEFSGDTITSIVDFDPVNNKTGSARTEITVSSLKNEKMSNYLLDVIEAHSTDYILVFDQADELFQLLYELYQSNDSQRDNGILTTISKQLEGLAAWHLVNIAADEKNSVRFDLTEAPLFANDLNRLIHEVTKYTDEGWQIILTTNKEAQILPALTDNDIKFDREISDQSVIITPALHVDGFMSPSLKTILLTDKEIFSPIVEKSATTKPTPKKRQLAFLAQIEKGDYVVHVDYGIGKLIDISTMTVNGVAREYLIIKYAGADKIYAPMDQIDKISKYISPAGEKPTLSKLNSQSWKRLVSQIRKESQEFAKELLDLYAKRALKEGISFDSPEFWEKALSDSFSYQETPDQEQVIQEILGDMEQSKPMDRLLVADVGFGKTEVAIRAAFKAVTSGFQVAFLAPTTILVEQHLKTFTERLAPFGVNIAALSRFRSQTEQKRVLVGLKTREIDIVIGTHRLLSKDVKFANLGLIIVDEEQRFGVRHKEKLKMMRAEVDVLSMTATPIPRTLNLALSGIRDISTIDTPPVNRLPIQTTVAPFDMDAVKDAVLQEIKRGGQIYFVHNRVATIASMTNKLEEVLPEVRFVYAHGQMPERLLAKIMEDFSAGKYDVLVASTIIENGLDNPNVNTLIVDNSSHFGLSQLHQLRGRIGRGKVQAHAYFYYHPGKLAGKALERLRTIAGHTELGSGYQIALRDLQIRGAGGVLSKKQHGHISAIGLTMYTKLLNRAIEELKTGYKPRVDTITVDLPISAYLPATYIDNEAQRIKTYQQLALVETINELKDAAAELEVKFGKLPKEVLNLFELIDLKITALETQKVVSMLSRNEAGIRRTPEQIISVILNTVVKDSNILNAISNLNGKITEKTIKIPLSALGEHWLSSLKKVIQLLK